MLWLLSGPLGFTFWISFALVFSSSVQSLLPRQGSKISLVRSYLRVPQAAGQVKILIFLVKINLFPMYTNIFVMQGK